MKFKEGNLINFEMCLKHNKMWKIWKTLKTFQMHYKFQQDCEI